MNTLRALKVPLFAIILSAAAGPAAPAAEGLPDREKNLTSRELDTKQRVVCKQFCVAMRRNDLEALRDCLDPEFLKGLELGSDAKLPMDIAPVLGIYQIMPSSDGRTVLCLYTTSKNEKEAILLQTIQRNGRVYILPPQLPEESGNFEPWILRTEMGEFAEERTGAGFTLKGVIEQKPWTKTLESWNAGGGDYFVIRVKKEELPEERRTGDEAVESIILRPSQEFPAERFKKLIGKRVTCRGAFVEVEPYDPARDEEGVIIEQIPAGLADPLTGEIEPPLRGGGFKVFDVLAVE